MKDEKETAIPQNTAVSPPKPVRQKTSQLVRWMSFESKNTRNLIAFIVLTLVLLATIALAYFCWFKWMPALWKWGFEPATWRGIFSVLGAIYLVMIPFAPFYYFKDFTIGLFKSYADDAEQEYLNMQHELENKQQFYGDILKESDVENLIPLVNFSRIELEQYYKIGLSQTRRSYKYSIIAMWIGFAIITFGILSYIVPTSYINDALVGGNFQILTIGCGIVTEIIAALFLWIYKSSINQLTYFYNRQIFVHNSLLAYRIAGTMKEPDKSKATIVEKILDFGLNASKPFDLNKEKAVSG